MDAIKGNLYVIVCQGWEQKEGEGSNDRLLMRRSKGHSGTRTQLYLCIKTAYPPMQRTDNYEVPKDPKHRTLPVLYKDTF